MRTISLIIFISYFTSQFSNAQGCCTPGTSTLGGIERGIISKNFLVLNLSYQNNTLDEAFENEKRIEDPLGRIAEVSTLATEVEYGLADYVSIVVTGIYSIRNREQNFTNSLKETERINYSGKGFGDLAILGKYQLVTPSLTVPFEIGIGGGANLPVGNYALENYGARLAIDLQPGTGAPGLVSWMYILYHFPSLGLRLFGDVFYRYPGSNFENYRFGNEILPTLGFQYRISDYLGASILLKTRIAKEDYSNSRILESTGSTTISIVPAFLYIEGNSTARVFLQMPLYRKVNGIQLTVSRLFGLEFQFGFSLKEISL